MPTDVNVPKFRSDCCQTVYEGADALRAAEWDESRPIPDPLPNGTWLVNSLRDLLDKSRWRRVIGHHVVPEWDWSEERNPDTPTDLALDRIVSPHRGVRVQHRAVDRHVIEYDERYETPRRSSSFGSTTVTETAAYATDSDYLRPHRPGVLNFGFGIDRAALTDVPAWAAGEAVGRLVDSGSMRPRKVLWEESEAADDREALDDLTGRLLVDGDRLALTRYVFGRQRWQWGDALADKNWDRQYTFLRPGLDVEAVDALMAICDDDLNDFPGGRDRIALALLREPPERERRYWARGWEPSVESPIFGVTYGSGNSGTAWAWLEALALIDHGGDPVGAMRWLVTSTMDDKHDRIVTEVRKFLDGDTSALIHANLLRPSNGMSRGPREGLLRPEHKDAAKTLGVDWKITSAKDALAPYIVTAGDLLNDLGVDMPETLNQPLFGGAPIVAVASGKGGVGKTTVSAALAMAAAERGLRVLVVDVDVTGPSLGALFDLPTGIPVDETGDLLPTEVRPGLVATSASQVVGDDSALAKWGEDATCMWLRFIGVSPNLNGPHAPDLVVLDMPPGYTAQHRAVEREMKPTASVYVTTGSPIAHADLRRVAKPGYSRTTPPVGLIENLSATPSGERLYNETASPAVAEALSVPFLGSLPWEGDPERLGQTAPVQAALDAVLTRATTGR